jgi:hypothetical protein
MQFAVTVTNNSAVNWTVNGMGSVDSNGNYTAPTVTQNSTATITATSVKDPKVWAAATITIVAPGVVTPTANAQVAQYTISVPDGLSVLVQFSTDTSYGFTTWAVPAPAGGGAVPILVAGMKGNTEYHMRAAFQITGTTSPVFTDVDHTFTTTAYSAGAFPSITATVSTGQTPQTGVELLNIDNGVITDLAGNVLWAYAPGTTVSPTGGPAPIKLLPNGHFLLIFYGVSPADGANSLTQEIDLTGKVIWQMTAAQLNAALAKATCSGCNITVVGNHHDAAVLPNGHLVLIASTQQTISGTVVTGDVLIDLDQNHNPVWLWNEFDHLDVSRRPMQFPDWTHTNAVTYSPDDKSLVVSSRHQSWIMKVNYNDGAGDGSLIWTLGYQGDFNLLPGTTNAVSPVDWFSAQHDANIISSNTSGAIDILLFDNGNQRILDSSGTLCSPSTTPCDSRVPIYHLDEAAKTAEITWVDKLAPVFSFFGGSARLLSNGNIEFDECGLTQPNQSSAIYEVTKTSPPVVVWQMQIQQYDYRGTRIGSLYPGVQW